MIQKIYEIGLGILIAGIAGATVLELGEPARVVGLIGLAIIGIALVFQGLAWLCEVIPPTRWEIRRFQREQSRALEAELELRRNVPSDTLVSRH